MNKESLLGLVLCLVLLFLFSGTGLAFESQSEYFYQMKVGDYISTISNQFNLDYSGELNSYHLRLMGEISKDYRFVEGIKKPQDVGYDNYRLILSKDDSKFGLGIVSPEDRFSQIIPTELLGSTLKYGSYQVWAGNSISRNFFSGGNNKQLGFSYKDQEKKLAYQIWQETPNKDIYNQYFNYKDHFKLSKSDLSLSTTGAFNVTDKLAGLRNRLRYRSRFKGIDYTVIGDYRSADFQAVDSPGDVGYGNYQVSGQMYYSFPAVLLNFNSRYTRNNLNRKLEETTRNLNNNWQINYYEGGAKYYLDLSYNTQVSYALEEESSTERTNDQGIKLGYEIKDFSTYVDYNRTNDSNRRTISLYGDYDKNQYRINSNYKWIQEKDSKEREWAINSQYNKKMFDKVNYDLAGTIEREEKLKISLSQGLSYEFLNDQHLSTTLDLSKYAAESEISKQLYINYKYRF